MAEALKLLLQLLLALLLLLLLGGGAAHGVATVVHRRPLRLID